jgi:hypothetical protein
VIARYSKAIGALMGALTPGVVMFGLGVVGWHINATVAAGVCTVCAAAATALFPANAAKAPSVRPPTAATGGTAS